MDGLPLPAGQEGEAAALLGACAPSNGGEVPAFAGMTVIGTASPSLLAKRGRPLRYSETTRSTTISPSIMRQISIAPATSPFSSRSTGPEAPS